MWDKTENIDVGDSRAGSVSILYLLLSLGFIGWLLFDIWIDAHTLARILGYDLTELKTPIYHLVAYTVLGGAMGGIVNGLRSAVTYYKGFDPHFLWKYIAAPWMGAALALIGFALLKSTVAIFGGTASAANADTPQFLANFAIGALAGYGSKDVFIWLDSQVHNLFASKKATPDTTGQQVDVAVNQIQDADRPVGAVVGKPVENPEEVGKVVEQVPAPGTMIDSGQAVSLVVGTSSNGKRSAKDKKPRRKSAGS
jgi:hypothetical protein